MLNALAVEAETAGSSPHAASGGGVSPGSLLCWQFRDTAAALVPG